MRSTSPRALAPALALAVAAGCGRVELDPRPTELVDEGAAAFEAGTFLGTRWAGDHVELEAGATSGDFVSRVHDAELEGQPWGALAWEPGAPYGKALVDGGRAEQRYRAGGLDMRANVLLAHFDGTLADTSPAASLLEGTALGGFVAGRFGTALADTPQSYVHAAVTGPTSPFNFGTDSVTWALWVRTAAPCPGNAVFLGIENPGTGLRPHLWLGCTPVAGGPAGGLGNTWCATRGAQEDCASAEGTTPLTTGTWRHLAIVKQGHAPATLTSYLDGELQASVQTSYLNPIVFDPGVELAIGALSRGDFPAEGELDEVAIWRRALTRDEVVALYRRGAQRLTVQVRACDEPTCAGVPFVGPAGDAQRSYADPANGLEPPTALPLTVAGRYLQYRVHFEADAPGLSPALYSVRVANR